MTTKESRWFRFGVNVITLCQIVGQTFFSPHNMVGWAMCAVAIFCACNIHRSFRRSYEQGQP
jgi:hypothetical protein